MGVVYYDILWAGITGAFKARAEFGEGYIGMVAFRDWQRIRRNICKAQRKRGIPFYWGISQKVIWLRFWDFGLLDVGPF